MCCPHRTTDWGPARGVRMPWVSQERLQWARIGHPGVGHCACHATLRCIPSLARTQQSLTSKSPVGRLGQHRARGREVGQAGRYTLPHAASVLAWARASPGLHCRGPYRGPAEDPRRHTRRTVHVGCAPDARGAAGCSWDGLMPCLPSPPVGGLGIAPRPPRAPDWSHGPRAGIQRLAPDSDRPTVILTGRGRC